MTSPFSPLEKKHFRETISDFVAERDAVRLSQARTHLQAKYPQRAHLIDGMATAFLLRSIGFAKSYDSADGPEIYRKRA